MIKTVNQYQLKTLIQLVGNFYNVQANVLADPQTVSLFIEDPSRVITQIASNLLVRSGVGQYYYNFMPTSAGLWKYKWQGAGVTGVVATSPDTSFFVVSSDFVNEIA